MTLFHEPKIGLVSTRKSRNITLLRMVSTNASSRQLRNSTQSSTNPSLFFLLSPQLPIQPMSIFKQLKTNRLMKNLLYKTLLKKTFKSPQESERKCSGFDGTFREEIKERIESEHTQLGILAGN